ncbi:MAG TPA: (d)CMP kinase [Solirubrobacteraceae bacterium]|jgi:cytidylate kinase
MVVAIDGPAGAGKSTVARALARELGFTYLDSGAMYRCVALLALGDRVAVPAQLAQDAKIELAGAGVPVAQAAGPVGAADCAAAAADCVLLDGRDVTAAIRTPEVSEEASRVAADPDVRAALVAKQRALLTRGDWVAEGRDIGTVVAPEAELKVFLTADRRERARRRARELGADAEVVLAEQVLRDERDATRAHSPLQAATGAVEVDTTGLTVEQVVGRIAALTHDIAPQSGSSSVS